jgi:hypothetical protein
VGHGETSAGLWRHELAPSPGIPWPLNLPLPEFLHGFNGMKEDLTAFQKAKRLQEKILFLETGHF